MPYAQQDSCNKVSSPGPVYIADNNTLLTPPSLFQNAVPLYLPLTDQPNENGTLGYNNSHNGMINSASIPTSASTVELQYPVGTNSLPIDLRQKMLQLHLFSLKAKQREMGHELYYFYGLQANKLEGERTAELLQQQSFPWMLTSINCYYDIQHHSLIDRVEQSLKLLQGKTATPVDTSQVETINSFNNPPQLPTQPLQAQDMTTEKRKIKAPRNAKARFVSIFNPAALRIMTNWYERNKDYPYPSNETCEVIAKAGSIGIQQVKKWFSNKRTRDNNTKHLTDIANARHRRVKRSALDKVILMEPNKRQCVE